jgi:excisionase family DNA binding protein
MTVAQAAKVLGLSLATVRRHVQEGRMKGERVGARVWLIPEEEIERWKGIGKLKRGPKPRPPRAAAEEAARDAP